MENNYERAAEIFKALCDENRIKIIELLQSSEKCGNALLEELDIAQPTLSHHMKILCASGMVEARKDGKKTYYSLDKNSIQCAKELLDGIVSRPVSQCPVWYD